MSEGPRDGEVDRDGGVGRDDAVRRHGDGEAPRAGEEGLFAALDRTRSDLAAAPAPALPEGFAARMQAALAAERATGAPAGPDPAAGAADDPVPTAGDPREATGTDVTRRTRPPGRGSGLGRDRGPRRDVGSGRDGGPGRDVGPARDVGPGRRRRQRLLAGGLVALAVVAAVTVGLALGTRPTGSPAPTAAPPVPTGPSTAPESPATVSAADPVRALRSGLGARDAGPLSDPARRSACLVAHGLPADTVPLGSRQVVVDGAPGTLLVLPTGMAARFRLLAVGPTCAPGSPATLVDLTVGG